MDGCCERPKSIQINNIRETKKNKQTEEINIKTSRKFHSISMACVKNELQITLSDIIEIRVLPYLNDEMKNVNQIIN